MTENNLKNISTQKKMNFWSVISLIVFTSLVVVSYKFRDFLVPKNLEKVAFDTSCNLRKAPCVSKLPNGGTVSFKINPIDIPLMKPLILQVKIEGEGDGKKLSSVVVDFVGIGMEMGFNRSMLELVEKNNYMGKAILPICSNARMDWEARVTLQTDKGAVTAPFRFYTEK